MADEALDIVFTTPEDDLVGEAAFGQPSEIGRQGKLMKLAGWIDLDSKLTVCHVQAAYTSPLVPTYMIYTDWLCRSCLGLYLPSKR